MEKKQKQEFYETLDSLISEKPASLETGKIKSTQIVHRILTKEEEQMLLSQVALGDEKAIELMTLYNQRLVLNIAQEIKEFYYYLNLSFEDLVQEGNIGLFKAIQKFDTKTDNKFSSYATYWVTATILRFIKQHSKNIHIPVNKSEKIAKLAKIRKQLTLQLDRTPTTKELAQEMGMTEENILFLMTLLQDTISLNTKLPNSEDEIEYYIEGNIPTPEQLFFKKELVKDINHFLENCNLKEREKRIIEYYFGINGKEKRKLESIGKEFGISKQAVNQVQKRAIEKMKKSPSRNHLASYLNKDFKEIPVKQKRKH